MYGCEDPEEIKERERWREIEEREEYESQNSENYQNQNFIYH